MSKRKSLIPSKEMRMHYNHQLTIRMERELPDVGVSKFAKSLRVRAQWGRDSPDPKRIIVILVSNSGVVTRLREKLYGFPSGTLIAKLGLLL